MRDIIIIRATGKRERERKLKLKLKRQCSQGMELVSTHACVSSTLLIRHVQEYIHTDIMLGKNKNYM